MTISTNYSVLDALRIFEKKHLPWMRSIEDRDLINVICTYQRQNKVSITSLELYALDIEPRATIQRRLNRLIALGILFKKTFAEDARLFEIGLSDSAINSLKSYITEVENLFLKAPLTSMPSCVDLEFDNHNAGRATLEMLRIDDARERNLDHINIFAPSEVTYWCDIFGCTAEKLCSVVHKVGIVADIVQEELNVISARN